MRRKSKRPAAARGSGRKFPSRHFANSRPPEKRQARPRARARYLRSVRGAVRIENAVPPVVIELLPSMTPRQKAGSPLVGDQKSHDGPCRRVRSARRARLEPCGRDSHFFRVQTTLVPIRACCEIVWAIASNEVFRISPSCLAQKVPLLEQKLSLGSVELQVRREA